MYGIHPYIWLIFMVNVGKYTIHGSYGFEAIDDETFTPSIHPSLKTPRILRSFNTEWSNTSCTSAKAELKRRIVTLQGCLTYPPKMGNFESMIFRTSRLVGYVIVPWRVLQSFQLEYRSFSTTPFCKISLWSLKDLCRRGSKHLYSTPILTNLTRYLERQWYRRYIWPIFWGNGEFHQNLVLFCCSSLWCKSLL